LSGFYLELLNGIGVKMKNNNFLFGDIHVLSTVTLNSGFFGRQTDNLINDNHNLILS